MASSETIHPQYVIDEKGEKTHVILSINDYLDLIEDTEDIEDLNERKKDPRYIPFSDVKAQLDL
jgi:hypothetical protein